SDLARVEGIEHGDGAAARGALVDARFRAHPSWEAHSVAVTRCPGMAGALHAPAHRVPAGVAVGRHGPELAGIPRAPWGVRKANADPFFDGLVVGSTGVALRAGPVRVARIRAEAAVGSVAIRVRVRALGEGLFDGERLSAEGGGEHPAPAVIILEGVHRHGYGNAVRGWRRLRVFAQEVEARDAASLVASL